MAKLPASAVSGRWTGHLLDVRGYEGELVLELEARRGSVSGAIEALIGETHESRRQRVRVKGEYGEDRVRIAGVVDDSVGVELSLDLVVFPLAGDGYGMRGTYRVGARSFSPMRDGVIAAAKDLPIPAEEIKPMRVVPRRGREEAS